MQGHFSAGVLLPDDVQRSRRCPHAWGVHIIPPFTMSATGTPSPAASFPAVLGSQVPRRTIVLTLCREIPHFSAYSAHVQPLSASVNLIYCVLIVMVPSPSGKNRGFYFCSIKEYSRHKILCQLFSDIFLAVSEDV